MKYEINLERDLRLTSVNASNRAELKKNRAELVKQEDIDGFLVGGASLKVRDLFKIYLTSVLYSYSL